MAYSANFNAPIRDPTLATIREAGGIVVRFDADVPQILLVRAKQHPEHWIFPKGHIEAGESAAAAAAREVREEAGIEAVPVGTVGALEFASDGDTVQVEHFLLDFVRAVGRGEPREARWCSYDESLSRLTFADARELLKRAGPHIERLRRAKR
jgi:8-oxo-dGTP pyrophosphatase MutT (NUDIX family)